MTSTRPVAIATATFVLLGASGACLAQQVASDAGSAAHQATADLWIQPRITPLRGLAGHSEGKSEGVEVFQLAALPRVPGPTTITHLHRNAAGELVAVCTVQHAPVADPHGASQLQEHQR